MMVTKLAMVSLILVAVLGTQVVISKGMTLSLCNLTQDDLVTCKPAVTKANPPVDPTTACCAALTKADFTCLCSYKNSMMLPAYGIDPDLAMQLPDKCKLNSTGTKC